MKNRILATSFSLTLLTAAAALGQSNALSTADIPFEFHVGTTVLPAGHYLVRPGFANGVLSIQSLNRGAMIITGTIEAQKAPTTGKLVFNRYGDSYFLSKVWTAGDSVGRKLPIAKMERELARNSSSAPPSEVVVARR